MFLFHKPSQAEIETFVSRQRTEQFSYREVGATAGMLPLRYTIDRNGTKLGQGAETFRVATSALRLWVMFKLGWVDVFPANAPIEVGTTVGVLVNHFGFWSLNASRVVYVVKEPRSFGFAYGTLQDHAEKGEERFSVDWLEEDDCVYYNLLAFSQPRKWQAKLFPPLSRKLQKRFAVDSMAAMRSGTLGP